MWPGKDYGQPIISKNSALIAFSSVSNSSLFFSFRITFLTPTILWSILPSNNFFPLYISSEKLILDEDKKKKKPDKFEYSHHQFGG